MKKLVKLFEPGMIGNMAVKNRIVMPPMGTFSAEEGFITERMIDYYVARAKGGVGLIITQVTAVDPRAPGGKTFTALWDDKFIPRLKELTTAVHEYGCKIAVQLGHHGAMHSDAGRILGYRPDEIDVVGTSAIPYLPTGVAPRELSKEDIDKLVEAFSEAARRSRDAGCDTVEIHGAHGRLVNQFASSFYNKRQDKYGGVPENRIRFACEIISRTREKLGSDFPIIYRISGDDLYIGGTTKEEAIRQAVLVANAGANAIHVSAGDQAFSNPIPTYAAPPHPFVHLAEGIKKVVDIPVIAVGKLGEPTIAERILVEGKADFISMGRPLFADPELPNKAKEGQLEEIRRCLYCNNCMVSISAHLMDGKSIAGQRLSCTVNAALFRERDFMIQPTTSPKKVMVIGGGLAGMKAAQVLAERGHKVSLYEASERLGGQWNIASRGKARYATLTKTLSQSLTKAGVDVILNTKVDRHLVLEFHPDAVVLATGAIPATLDIPGADGKNVAQVDDVLAGKVEVGNSVVIIDGRHRGMEAALYLSMQGKKVCLVSTHQVGRDTEHFLYRDLRDKLVELRVPFYPFSQVVEISTDGVSIFQDKEMLSLKAATVILAVGSKPENKLVEKLKDIVPELHLIGDCKEPRSALEATNEGADIGFRI